MKEAAKRSCALNVYSFTKDFLIDMPHIDGLYLFYSLSIH